MNLKKAIQHYRLAELMGISTRIKWKLVFSGLVGKKWCAVMHDLEVSE